MKRLLIILLLLLALPAIAEEAVQTGDPSPTPNMNSVVEGGYAAPSTPTPAPTPELPPLRDDPMLQHVVEIAYRIDILAENERFMARYGYGVLSPERIETLSYGDHARPARLFHLNGETLFAALHAGADPAEMLDFSRPELQRDLVDELPQILWGRREDTELSVLSVLSRCKIFAMDDVSGCGVYILLYKDAAPVLVTWYAGPGCAEVAAYFLPDAELADADDANAVSSWFVSKGMPPVIFEEVPLT